MVTFNPDKDIPSLKGKVILITGGNIGLGRQCVLEFARHGPAEIWLAARSEEKGQAAAEEIKQQVQKCPPIKVLRLDLASLKSVKEAAATFTSQTSRIDILMLNAGIMATPPGLTEDGYEIQFGTNHVGHALLTKLLLPTLDNTVKSSPEGDVRIICLSSIGHNLAPKGGILFETLKTTAAQHSGWARYGQSKLANALFARRLAALYPQFKVAAIHPGGVRTNLSAGATDAMWIVEKLTPLARLFFASVEKGAYNQLWASVTKDLKSGEYYTPVGLGGKASAHGKDDDLAKKLWEWTEKELAAYV